MVIYEHKGLGAKGMLDLYEIKYGCVDSGMCDPESPLSCNEVEGKGWQHPFIHNARYAVLIGGGATGPDKNFPCFWNDIKLTYKVLAYYYHYLNERQVK